MAYTKYSLTPSSNTAAPPDGAPEGMLPSAVNDTMRDMMAQIRDCGDGIRGGTYTMTAPIITGGTINGATIGATTASTGKFTAVTNSALTSGRVTYAGTAGVLQDDADFTFNGTTVTMANDASISGLTVGKGGGAVASNTALGTSALTANTSGSLMTAVGYQALQTNSTGDSNTAVGYRSLNKSTGTNCTAIGYLSGYNITSGANNNAMGTQALYLNTTGASNTALGDFALYSNTTASNNTAVGYQAAYSNTTGTIITAIGRQALYNNTTGTDNTALSYAMVSNTTGSQNTGIGTGALQSNTTGGDNTAVGYRAGYSTTTPSFNTFVGRYAGYTNTTGAQNTGVGVNSLYALTTGSGNTALGISALEAMTTGANSVGIGNNAGSAITTGSKNTIIGSYTGNQGGLDIRTANNWIVLSDGDGNPRARWSDIGALTTVASGTDTYSFVARNTQATRPYGIWSNFSGASPNNTTQTFLDCEDTTNIKAAIYSSGAYGSRPNSYGGLSDIKLKQDIVDASSQWNDIKAIKVRKFRFKDDPNSPLQIGVVAQEIEQTSAGLVYETPDFTRNENGEKVETGETTKAVKYSILYMKAIKALQEAMERIETLEAKVTALENK